MRGRWIDFNEFGERKAILVAGNGDCEKYRTIFVNYNNMKISLIRTRKYIRINNFDKFSAKLDVEMYYDHTAVWQHIGSLEPFRKQSKDHSFTSYRHCISWST